MRILINFLIMASLMKQLFSIRVIFIGVKVAMIHLKKNQCISLYKFPAKQIDSTHFERLPSNEPFKYEYEIFGNSVEEVKQEFLKAKIFDGKSFLEVENDLAWLDE